jgi:hypothetical protein
LAKSRQLAGSWQEAGRKLAGQLRPGGAKNWRQVCVAVCVAEEAAPEGRSSVIAFFFRTGSKTAPNGGCAGGTRAVGGCARWISGRGGEAPARPYVCRRSITVAVGNGNMVLLLDHPSTADPAATMRRPSVMMRHGISWCHQKAPEIESDRLKLVIGIRSAGQPMVCVCVCLCPGLKGSGFRF